MGEYSREKPMTTTLPGKRSNRMHTQRILVSLERFLLLAEDHDDRTIRQADSGKAHVNYDTTVWELYYDGMFLCNVEKTDRGIQVLVTTGGYLDAKSNATRTTREFINGVLDHLEGWGLLSHSRMYVYNDCTYLRNGNTTIQMSLKQQYASLPFTSSAA
jgi:hypothetical protein